MEESRIPSSQHEDEDKRFSDLFPGFPPEENGQFTLVFIKPEVSCVIHTTCVYAAEELI